MKAVLIAIQPKWCELIASGKKTIEVRKTCPKLNIPFKCYIYQTRHYWVYRLLEKLGLWRGKVIGEFVCDSVDTIAVYNEQLYAVEHFQQGILQQSCLSIEETKKYLGAKSEGYAWHISDLVIYDKPKELGEFWRPCPDRSAEKILDCVVGIKSCKYKTEALPFQCTANLQSPPQSWRYVEA